MKRLIPLTLLVLPACAVLQKPATIAAPEVSIAAPEPDQLRPRARPSTLNTAPPPPKNARTVEAFDTTSAAERAEAAAPPAPATERTLGTTIATLGTPTEPGFWAKTPLVTSETPGRLEDPASGKSVKVTLIPSGGEPGSGSRVSLAALRVLEVSLAGLPELKVFAGPS